MLLLLFDWLFVFLLRLLEFGVDWNLRMLNTFYAERSRHTLPCKVKVSHGLEFTIHNLSINRVAVQGCQFLN